MASFLCVFTCFLPVFLASFLCVSLVSCLLLHVGLEPPGNRTHALWCTFAKYGIGWPLSHNLEVMAEWSTFAIFSMDHNILLTVQVHKSARTRSQLDCIESTEATKSSFVMMSHEQITYSSIASVLHELDIQSTSLVAQESANLMYSLSKIMTLNSNDVAAIITTRTACRVLRI